MSNEAIIQELAGIRASAQVLADRSERLMKMMDQKPVPNTGKFNLKIARVLASKEKRLQKNNRFQANESGIQ